MILKYPTLGEAMYPLLPTLTARSYTPMEEELHSYFITYVFFFNLLHTKKIQYTFGEGLEVK